MKIQINMRNGTSYWLDDTNPNFHREMHKILAQSGGWTMLKPYGKIGYVAVPTHLVAEIRPIDDEKDAVEFEKIMRIMID